MVTTYTYDLADEKFTTYANRLMQYVIDDPADTLDETVWYYYDDDGKVERIVRKLDSESVYRSTRFVYMAGGLVQNIIGEQWDDDGLGWLRRDGAIAWEYAKSPTAMTWNDAKTYAEGKGGVLVSMHIEDDFNWVLENLEPAPGYTEQRYWVGAYQDGGTEPDQGWKWLLDDFVIFYDPWQPGQPDDGGSADHDVAELVFVEAGTDGLNDTDDTLQRPAIIQCIAGDCENAVNFERTYAWEFRYDDPRARYLRRELDPATLEPQGSEWSDYAGASVYGDFSVSGGQATDHRSYALEGSHIDHDGQSWADERYYHADQIGTTRLMTDDTPAAAARIARTAFGEMVSTSGAPDTRYHYAGVMGYQTHEEFPFLHVGGRYYDPETGRFLQADPIGISGGLNVYAYVANRPTMLTDPTGNGFFDGDNWFHNWVATNLWGNIHSVETLANMSDTQMYAEAIGGSVVVGFGGYWGITYALSPTAGSMGLGYGGRSFFFRGGSEPFVVGYLALKQA